MNDLQSRGQRIAMLRSVLHEHELRNEEIDAAIMLARNTLTETLTSLAAADEALTAITRLQREHHDQLVASVLRALNQEIG